MKGSLLKELIDQNKKKELFWNRFNDRVQIGIAEQSLLTYAGHVISTVLMPYHNRNRVSIIHIRGKCRL